jgi:hypothetical protein
MSHHHLVERETFIKANTALMLTFVWGGLAACAVGATVFDIGRMLAVW